MNSPIVLVELHLLVRLTPAALHPYSQQQKETLLSKFVYREPLMTLSPELVIITLLDGALPPFNIGLTT